jgi:hypothetical protein
MFSDTTYQGAKKNSSDQSEELSIFFVDIIKLVSDLSVPIFHRDGVGTLLSACNLARYTASAGCQGFFGPFPSAFLDKRCCKNCGKGKIIRLKLQNFFFWELPRLIHISLTDHVSASFPSP